MKKEAFSKCASFTCKNQVMQGELEEEQQQLSLVG